MKNRAVRTPEEVKCDEWEEAVRAQVYGQEAVVVVSALVRAFYYTGRAVLDEQALVYWSGPFKQMIAVADSHGEGRRIVIAAHRQAPAFIEIDDGKCSLAPSALRKLDDALGANALTLVTWRVEECREALVPRIKRTMVSRRGSRQPPQRGGTQRSV